ncbi:MAG: aminoacyl-tRNA deacylase [Ignavibacteriales bacterium]
MKTSKVKEFLDKTDIPYKKISHPLAFTAQEVAATAHIKGREFAKTVMIKINGRLAMTVLPASHVVDFEKLKRALNTQDIKLATETEFKIKFPDCELGAMPPFGNLYDMDVYVCCDLLDNEEIAFNAGSHTDVIEMTIEEFRRIVGPIELDFTKKHKV